jgi:hypothetical protein
VHLGNKNNHFYCAAINQMLALHCLMWAAAFPFTILSLDVVAVFGFEAIFLAHLLAVSWREFVIVRVAHL